MPKVLRVRRRRQEAVAAPRWCVTDVKRPSQRLAGDARRRQTLVSHPRRRRQGGRGCAVLIQHEQFPSARASRRSNHNTSSVTTTHFLIYIYTYLRTYFTRVIKVELNQQPPNMQQQAWRGSGLPQCRAGTPCSDMSRTKEYICTGYICSLTVSSSADLCPALLTCVQQC